ncbi:MAG TPA: hypothetical protein DIT93_06640 [Pelagibacterium sp.]|uniref:phage tail assembly chaperone n=1 Tax=uncultured Pelagibacterium sp. TaxID=1159875 RepID=UPI000C4B13F7|nr:hypothetical protein [Pelagibacterium sp.]HCO54681.1 hypothetical protein [Pelagibacterium sp.]|tara:strand:+ start:5411 stop:5767 length:357 start_codon:yes stop_codon:yes gene_type:complete
MRAFQALKRQLCECLIEQLEGRRMTVPEAGQIIWRMFIDLCTSRTYHGAGPNPITHSEIRAYLALYRWPLEPRHVDLIFAMDRVWLDHAHRQQRLRLANQPSANDPTLDRGAFDAVFG